MNKISYMDMTIQSAGNAPQTSLNLDAQINNAQYQATRLPLSTILVGIVAGNDKNGNLIVRLAGNDLILSSPLALGKNAQLALKLENVSGTIVAQLLSVDGKLPATQPQTISNQLQNPQNQLPATANLKIISVLNEGAAKVAPPPVQPEKQSAAPPAIKSDIVSLTSTQTTNLKAILIAASPEAAQVIKGSLLLGEKTKTEPSLRDNLPEELKTGSTLNLRITNAQNPKQDIQTDNRVLAKQDWMTAEVETTDTENPEAKLIPQLNTPGTSTPKQLPTQLAQQVDMQKLVQNFQPTAKESANGNLQLSAIVLDKSANGELLVDTKIGKMVIDAGTQFSSINKGATLTLEINKFNPAEAPKITLDISEETTLARISKDWPALQQLLQHTSPSGVNQEQLISKLSGVDSIFASRLANFASAVATGNLKDWLGQNKYDELSSDDVGNAILGKLKSDMSMLRDNLNQTSSTGWQTLLFPVYDGRELHQARIHVKYLPDEEGNPDKKTGTRFLVELETSNFGEMQFDGLVKANIAKHFDLMIRTHSPLDMMIKQDIHQIFTDAGEITGLKGNLEFSVMREFPVRPLEEKTAKNISRRIDHKGFEA